MADNAAALVVKLEARINDFEKNMRKAGVIADKAVSDIEKKFSSLNPGLAGGLQGLFGGLAAGAAAVGLQQIVSAGRQAIGTLADLNDEAQRVGTSTDFLQQFAYAVQLSGGHADEANAALERFAKGLSQAGAGAGDLYKVFQANGVAIRDAKGQLLSVQDALAKYADLVKNAANPQDQLNLAAIAFGRSAGPALVNALKDGSAGLQEMADEATRTGGVIDSEVIAKAAELDDKFTALEISASNWAKSLAVAIADFAIPQLQDLINTVNTVLNLLGTKVTTFMNNPQLATGNAMLKAGNGSKLGGADDLSQFYDAQGDNFDAARLAVTITKPTKIPGPSGGGGRSRRGGGFKRDRAADVIAELQLELEKTQAVGDARDAIITKEKILQEQRHANVDAVSDEGKKIAELVTAIEAAEKAVQQTIKIMDDIRDVASTGLDTFVGDLLDGKSAAEALNDSLKNMLNTIARIAEENLIESLFGKGGTAGGGLLSGLFGGITSFFGGAKAGGGPVQGGKAYLVGEHGPEMIVPRGSGTVIPNDAIGGMGGGVVVNIANYSSESVQQSSSKKAGGLQLDVVIGKVAAKQASTGGTDLNRALKGTFGLQTGLTRR